MSNDHPICTVDPYKFLEIKQNPDGSITRLAETPSSLTRATPDPTSTSPVLSQDQPLNPTHKTFLRVFLPKATLTSLPHTKLPIIAYFHGGGFVFHHADSSIFHTFCSALALQAQSIVVSVEYRLAPEHRLPAAYEDAMEALHWIRSSASNHHNTWLFKHADYSNCFIMGSSAGGNIAYRAAIQASENVDDFQPLKIKGMILHQPFFGRLDRVGSELRLVNDPYVPLSASDLFWELGLPVAADRGHEFCDPRAGAGPGVLHRIKELGIRVLVTGCSGDPLVDHQIELVKLMDDKGVDVKGHFTEGDHHAVDIFDHVKCNSFLGVVKDFIGSCLAA